MEILKPLILSLFSLFVSYQKILPQEDTTTINLVFVGDIMGHDGQIKSAYNGNTKTYDYNDVFSFVSHYIKQADIAIGNLEVTLAGPPYTGYPQFSSPDQLAIALKNVGFDVLLTANNHCLDRGKNGLIRTIKILDSLNILHTGTFLDNIHRDTTFPLIIKIKDFIIALLNYTYGTNGIKVQPPVIVNYIDTTIISKDIEKAKKYNPDFIIPILHWGNEYERNYNYEQKNLAEFFIKKGIKIIIGSHPHVVQPIEITYSNNNDNQIIDKLIVYSLGNFVSNQRSRYRDGGIILKITFKKYGNNAYVANCKYLPVWVFAGNIDNDYEFRIVPYQLYKINPEILPFTENDKFKIEQFYQDTKSILNNIKEDEEIDVYQ